MCAMSDDGWRRDANGNLLETWPVPGFDLVGARFRHARLLSGLSQRRIAELAGVSQSSVSRLERGVSGGMRTEALLRIAISIPNFPLGYCPHGHRCAYPFEPPGNWRRQPKRQRAANRHPYVKPPRPSLQEIVSLMTHQREESGKPTE